MRCLKRDCSHTLTHHLWTSSSYLYSQQTPFAGVNSPPPPPPPPSKPAAGWRLVYYQLYRNDKVGDWKTVSTHRPTFRPFLLLQRLTTLNSVAVTMYNSDLCCSDAVQLWPLLQWRCTTLTSFAVTYSSDLCCSNVQLWPLLQWRTTLTSTRPRWSLLGRTSALASWATSLQETSELLRENAWCKREKKLTVVTKPKQTVESLTDNLVFSLDSIVGTQSWSL